jgi:hypothetical protein
MNRSWLGSMNLAIVRETMVTFLVFVASWTKTPHGGCPTAKAELITYSAQDVPSEYLNQTLRRH